MISVRDFNCSGCQPNEKYSDCMFNPTIWTQNQGLDIYGQIFGKMDLPVAVLSILALMDVLGKMGELT